MFSISFVSSIRSANASGTTTIGAAAKHETGLLLCHRLCEIDFFGMNMRFLSSIVLVAALAFTACSNPKKESKKAARTKKTPSLGEENADIDFQAFLGRLRQAVKAHDLNTIASMMTPDFAYVLGATPAEDRVGPGVFQYWDENNLWPELDGILSERFVAKGRFMVAPPQFADESTEYQGYRAGIRRVNGSWKFVYFVNG
jgi:hypothetical protein